MSDERSLPPGPGLPRLVQAWRYAYDLPRFFADARGRFGPTWTMRLYGFPPVVITSDRDAIRRLLTGDPLNRRHGNDLLEPLVGRNSLLVLEPAEHLARRRLELGPFHGERIRGFTERIRALFERDVATWTPGSVEVHPRAQQLTLAVILELVLGVRDGQLRAELAETFEAMNTPLSNLGLFLPGRLIRRARLNAISRPFWSLVDRLHELLSRHIAQTRSDPEVDQRSDVLALLVRARDAGGEGLTDEQLRDELVTLVAAGHETTATAIAWAAELLAHNPTVAAELRASLSTGDRDYLRATAKEVLRARTVAPVASARHVLEPFEVGGHVIGPEPVVVVDAYSIHRDPELYDKPDAFRPERFIQRPPDAYAYLPFGGGAHRCLGSALAMLELELAIEAIISAHRLRPAGPPASPRRRGVTLTPASRGRVLVERLARSRLLTPVTEEPVPVGNTPGSATTPS